MGVDYEQLSKVSSDRAANSGASVFQASLYPILSGFFGPFPNMNRMFPFGFVFSFGLLIKDFISPLFISNIISIIRIKNIIYYPLLCFCAANILMMIISGVSLDMRYHITYIPFFFIIALAPFNMIFEKYKLWIIWTVLLLIVVVYNYR